MIEGLHIDVLVDDIPAIEGVLPVHGLSLYLLLVDEHGSILKILFDTGPSDKILFKNAALLGVELKPDIIFGSLPHFHHIGALQKALHEEPRIIPPPPLAPREAANIYPLPGFQDVYVLAGDTYWNEQGLAVKTRKGWVVFLGCSVHGLRRTFGRRLLKLGRIWGLIGGFNISSRDNINLLFLKRLEKMGLELIIPLHSSSIEARKTILKGMNRVDFGYEVSGCGVQSDFQF